jgi:hypothetical protein
MALRPAQNQIRDRELHFRKPFVPQILAALAVPAFAFGLVACGDDDNGSEEERAAVQESIDAINQASLNANADEFLQYVTEKGAREIFFATPEQIREAPEETIAIESEDEFFVADEIEVDGDTADATGGFSGDPGETTLFAPMVLQFVQEDDVWKADGLSAGDAEEPEGAQSIDVSLIDFAFEFDETALESGSPVYFDVENDGQQPHHIVMVRVDEGVDLQEAIQSEEPPEGVEEVGFAGPWPSGEGSSVAYTEDLEPGRYAFLCFLPDISEPDPEQQVPHVALGMVKEFTIE